MDTHERKGNAKLTKLDSEGVGLISFATLSAIDHDGDTYATGAFGKQDAHILPAHNWSSVPLGRAKVFEEGDRALAELHFNLETDAGREWHKALKFDFDTGNPLYEWSYGYTVNDSTQETRDEDRVRVIRAVAVHEVSPVILGAGIDTGTLALKGSQPFAEQIDAAAAAVRDITGRAKEIKALRESQGRTLSADRQGQLGDLKAALEELGLAAGEIDELRRGGDGADIEAAGRVVAGVVANQVRRT